LLGLYRGIATNVASSAPISAVYTFSYESVKAALLPYLPKVAHLSLYSTYLSGVVQSRLLCALLFPDSLISTCDAIYVEETAS